MSILALIPARGGSKGLPGKNIIDFDGDPLLAWSVQAAQNAKSPISKIVVSTEDPEIRRVAEVAGAHCPFLRPSELATDTASGLDPVIHALDWFAENEDYEPDWLLLLQPTSPLRTAVDIDGAYDLAVSRNADSVMGVAEAQTPPLWTKKIDQEGRLQDFFNQKNLPATRQELEKAYVVNGAIYLIRVELLREIGAFSNDETLAYVMPPERSVDIDTEFDFNVASFLKSQTK